MTDEVCDVPGWLTQVTDRAKVSADAPLASGAPFLAIAEPTLLLLAFAFGDFG
jgi:hypothetical protein